jgi:nitroreductase
MSLLKKPAPQGPDAPPAEPLAGAAIDVILSRRSHAALVAPGPSAAQLAQILQAGTTVPDHGSLRPYRFLVASGSGRARVGEALVGAMREARPDAPEAALAKVRDKAFAAPTQVLLVASPRVGHKIAQWEQQATAACTGYAIALAAHALGLGAIWKNAPFDRGEALCSLLGLAPHERLLGWINVGTIAGMRALPEPPPLDTLVGVITEEGVAGYARE